MRYFGVHGLGYWRALESLVRFEFWNLWVHVGTNLGCAGNYVCRPPESLLAVVGLSSRRGGVIAFKCCVMLFAQVRARDGIFEFMLEQTRVVQGFLLVVHPKACSLLWVCQAVEAV